MDEPSVLDYLKAKLTPWRGPAPQVPPAPGPAVTGVDQTKGSSTNGEIQLADSPAATPLVYVRSLAIPWRTLAALFLALAAQSSLEPGPDRAWSLGVVLYTFSFILLGWAYFTQEWKTGGAQVYDYPPSRAELDRSAFSYNSTWFMLSLLLTLVGLWAFSGNRFNTFNLVVWAGAIILMIQAFWVPDRQVRGWPSRLDAFLRRPNWKVEISRETLPFLAAIALAVFFRVYRLEEVPPQMLSDHAEKLLDVWDVLQGQTAVFFTRNTGREGLQMYMIALVTQLFDLELNFLSMKIGTVMAGLLTLPYIYLLGRELSFSRRAGLLAMVFAGLAYWPNVISRIALRFALYPLFVAPVLYYLVRGLRTSRRNDFILAGLFLGIGLHGYSPIRVLPIVVLVGVGLYLLHRPSEGRRRSALFNLGVLVLVSLVVFLPLLSYALLNMDTFGYRTFSRMGSLERPLPGPFLSIFLDNLWKALTMFAWNNGSIWPISINNRPALDIVSGALFQLGTALLLFRYFRRRYWVDLFLLVSIPLLMLPSILSLAFPDENPALNRAGGALVPVFVVVGIALDRLLRVLEQRFQPQSARLIAWGLVGVLLSVSATQNYGLVFDRYQTVYETSSWNTTELGHVIRDFSNTFGNPDSAWVLAYPHWVDTRLVGIHAGRPTKDYAIFPDELSNTLSVPGPKLFLVKSDDEQGQERLKAFYPHGWFRIYDSQVENKDFLLFFVPPEGY
jgi:hypothetical protein